jgi:hypothetical protein
MHLRALPSAPPANTLLRLGHFVTDDTTYRRACCRSQSTATQHRACRTADDRTTDGSLILPGHTGATAQGDQQHRSSHAN